MYAGAFLMEAYKTGSSRLQIVHTNHIYKEVTVHKQPVPFASDELNSVAGKLGYIHFPGSKKYVLSFIICIGGDKIGLSRIASSQIPSEDVFLRRGRQLRVVTEKQLRPVKVTGGVMSAKVHVDQPGRDGLTRRQRGINFNPKNVEQYDAGKWFVLSSEGNVYYRTWIALIECPKRACQDRRPCEHNYGCSCDDSPKPCKHIHCIHHLLQGPGIPEEEQDEVIPLGSRPHVSRVNEAKWIVHDEQREETWTVRKMKLVCKKRFCEGMNICAHKYRCECKTSRRPCLHILCAVEGCNHVVTVPHVSPDKRDLLTTLRNSLASKMHERSIIDERSH